MTLLAFIILREVLYVAIAVVIWRGRHNFSRSFPYAMGTVTTFAGATTFNAVWTFGGRQEIFLAISSAMGTFAIFLLLCTFLLGDVE